LLLNFGIPVYM